MASSDYKPTPLPTDEEEKDLLVDKHGDPVYNPDYVPGSGEPDWLLNSAVNRSAFDHDSHENFEGRSAPAPNSDGADADRIRGGGEADGEIRYSPTSLLDYADRLEAEVLPLCEQGAERAAGIGDVRAGYFDHGLQLRKFCSDLESVHQDNFDAFKRGVLTLIEGCRTIGRRYQNANEETDDMVTDLRRLVEDAGAEFGKATHSGEHVDPDD